MKLAILGAAVLAVLSPAAVVDRSCGDAACPTAAVLQEDRDFDREIFFAVLEGLYTDGVSNAAADKILAIDEKSKFPVNFVQGCPICTPSYDAFRAYRVRPGLSYKGRGDTFGKGLPAAVERSILEGATKERQEAIASLIKEWMKRRFESLQLTEPQRDQWRMEMEIRMKKGMAMLQQYKADHVNAAYDEMGDCPFCVGGVEGTRGGN